MFEKMVGPIVSSIKKGKSGLEEFYLQTICVKMPNFRLDSKGREKEFLLPSTTRLK